MFQIIADFFIYNWQMLFIGIIPEAVFFSLFIIFAKNLKGYKSFLFAGFLINAYIILTYLLIGNIWFEIALIALLYIILKCLYGNGAGIMDLFLYMIANIFMMTVTYLFLIAYAYDFYPLIIAVILKSILLSLAVIFIKQIRKLAVWYKQSWNRDDSRKGIKSLTLRNISVIAFNLLILAIHFSMVINSSI